MKLKRLPGQFPETVTPAIAGTDKLLAEGNKFDAGKLRFDLIPPEAERDIALVFTGGAAKYGDRNWERGIKYSRLLAAARRHLDKYLLDEKKDPEFGASHLAHAIVNLMMMLSFDYRKMSAQYDDISDPGKKAMQEVFMKELLGGRLPE